jgi:fermentation-respiration switch protein FrsA (DUF1100 family)
MKHFLHPSFFKRLFGIFASIFAIYAVFLAILLLAQRSLMYFPDPTLFDPAANNLSGFDRLAYTTPDGLDIHGFYAPPSPPRHLTLVFFQGNAGNLANRADKIRQWRGEGYGVMLATYRGFHGNPGAPDEPGLYQDARAAIMALEARGMNRRDMIFYGESLGTGIAVQMASEGNPAGVILEAPYTSLPDVGAYRYPFVPIFWIMQDKYMSIEKVGKIRVPLLVLQAGRDYVVPSVFARRLYDAANEPKKILLNATAGHNTIYSSADLVRDMFLFMSDLEKGKAATGAVSSGHP